MAPKKTKKIDLNAFMGDTPGGSWADDLDALPTAPAAISTGTPLGPSGGFRDGGFRDGGFNDRLGSNRPELPFPTRPPYTASVNNLSYEITEHDLRQLFEFLKIKAIRIVMSEGRPKGNAFVEFETPEDLREALKRSGSDVIGRTAYVHIAAPESRAESGSWDRRGPLPPMEGGGGRGPSRADSGSWDRRGPLPPAEGKSYGPSKADTGSWDRRGPLPPAEGKSYGPSKADTGSWDRQGPLPPPEPRSRGPSRADSGSWDRRGPLPPVEGKHRGPSRADSGSWERQGGLPPLSSKEQSRNFSNRGSGSRRASSNSAHESMSTAEKEELIAKRRAAALKDTQPASADTSKSQG